MNNVPQTIHWIIVRSAPGPRSSAIFPGASRWLINSFLPGLCLYVTSHHPIHYYAVWTWSMRRMLLFFAKHLAFALVAGWRRGHAGQWSWGRGTGFTLWAQGTSGAAPARLGGSLRRKVHQLCLEKGHSWAKAPALGGRSWASGISPWSLLKWLVYFHWGHAPTQRRWEEQQ